MDKIHLYFVPGLAANTKIFDYISLPENIFELHFLDWILPLSIDETLASYAQRMCNRIDHKKPVLIGVSFGGIVVQEMSKLIDFKKVIIISSVKNNNEFPTRFKIAQKTGLYKLFPATVIQNIEKYEPYFLNEYFKKRASLYKMYLSIRDYNYLRWSIHNMLHWQQKDTLPYIHHIHGNKDEIFPVKNISNYIEINNGTHIMILNKAKIVSKIIKNTCLN